MRPEFWTDEDVAAWPEPLRLFYIGLWCVCDDAGYFELVPKRIAALLYPYDGKRREQRVAQWLAFLVTEGKVTTFADCQHAVVIHLKDHQKSGGNPSFTVRTAHYGEVRTGPESPVSNVTVSKGMERGGMGGSAAPQEARGGLTVVDGKWVQRGATA